MHTWSIARSNSKAQSPYHQHESAADAPFILLEDTCPSCPVSRRRRVLRLLRLWLSLWLFLQLNVSSILRWRAWLWRLVNFDCSVLLDPGNSLVALWAIDDNFLTPPSNARDAGEEEAAQEAYATAEILLHGDFSFCFGQDPFLTKGAIDPRRLFGQAPQGRDRLGDSLGVEVRVHAPRSRSDVSIRVAPG